MDSPQVRFKKFMFRIGKQIEPVIRLPDDGSVVDIRTNTLRDENYVVDSYKSQGWEIPPGSKVHAIYIDGIFKGHGHFVTDEGVAVELGRKTTPGTPGPQLGPGPQPGTATGPGSSHTVTPPAMDRNYSITGRVSNIEKSVVLKSSKDQKVITARYEGHIGTLSAINMIQRGSVLQPSMASTILYCVMSLLVGAFIIGPMVLR